MHACGEHQLRTQTMWVVVGNAQELVSMSATQLRLSYRTQKGMVELSKTYALTDCEIITVSAKRLCYEELLFLPKTELPVAVDAKHFRARMCRSSR